MTLIPRFIITLIPVLAAAGLSSAARADSSAVWAGADFGSESFYTYAGGVTALSDQDISCRNGLLLRLSVGYGEYSYDTNAVAGGTVDGESSGADLMLGYTHFFKTGSLSLYAGPTVEKNELSENDPENDAQGVSAGAKTSVDTFYRPMDKVTMMGMASYSTAFHSYWSHFSAVYDFGPVSIGPTAGIAGGEKYRDRRVGVSLADINLGFAGAYVNTGYSVNKDDDGSGYVGFGLGRSF